jgi:UDP-N-acetyl-D-glucosamine dehydrogenase
VSGLRVAVLGLAYRGGVKETALSGAWSLVEDLQKRGAHPVVHDPLYSDDEMKAHNLSAYHLGEAIDAALIQADHSEYKALTPIDLPGIQALIDGRNTVSDLQPWIAASVPVSKLGRMTV